MVAQLETMKLVWPHIENIISFPKTQKQYKKLVTILDKLVEEFRKSENHLFTPQMGTVGNIIESYKYEPFPEIESDPISILKTLLKKYSLSQNGIG